MSRKRGDIGTGMVQCRTKLGEAIGARVSAKLADSESRLGTLVRSLRKSSGMTQQELADVLGVSKQFISQIELGVCPLSEDDSLLKELASALKMDVSVLKAARPARALEAHKRDVETNPLGALLTKRRQELRLDQGEVGQKVGICAPVISKIETGKKLPIRDLADRLAKALKCQIPEELLATLPESDGRRKVRSQPKVSQSELGRYLASKRLERGMSQAEVGRIAGVSGSFISIVEVGEYVPKVSTLLLIAGALGCDIPVNLMPQPKARKKKVFWKKVALPDAGNSDL